jgi:putative sigma-54 modulation protein
MRDSNHDRPDWPVVELREIEEEGTFMQLFVTAHRVFIEPMLRRRIEKRLRFATDRFTRQIREIRVHLGDTNRSKGGTDKLCTVSAKFHDGDQIRVAQTSGSVMAALSGAARRLHQSLAQRIERRSEKQNAAVAGGITEYWIG